MIHTTCYIGARLHFTREMNTRNMDVVGSWASSIFALWERTRQLSLSELTVELEDYTFKKKHITEDYIGYPPPYLLFREQLERKMDRYIKAIEDGSDLARFNIICDLERFCEKNELLLRDLTLISYMKIVDYMLFEQEANNGRILVMWYITAFLLKKNPLSGSNMAGYFFDTLKTKK